LDTAIRETINTLPAAAWKLAGLSFTEDDHIRHGFIHEPGIHKFNRVQADVPGEVGDATYTNYVNSLV
jgi:hypothetical protein